MATNVVAFHPVSEVQAVPHIRKPQADSAMTLLAANVHPVVVQKAVGHASYRSTENYLKPSDATASTAIAEVFA